MVPQTSYKIIFALLFGVTILETFAQTRPRFDLVPSFTEGSNEVLFRCRDKMTSSPYSSALFWLNGTNLIDQADYVRSGASGGEIEFIITRQLEGNYTCGKLSPDGLTREESIPEAYVAYPEDDPSLPTEILDFEESGTTARLECAIKPGVLTTEYFVTWKNASSGENLINLVQGSLQSQYRTDTRYTIAQNDFSLLIEDVKPLDAGMYLCVLGVSGAQRFAVPKEYDQTKRINLTLQVFAFKCPALPIPENGTISYAPDSIADYDVGTVATYLCSTGFSLKGNRTRTCIILGNVSEWDGNDESRICTPLPNSVGLVLGITVGAVLLLILIIVTLFTIVLLRRKLNRSRQLVLHVDEDHIYEDPDEIRNNRPPLPSRNICVNHNEAYEKAFEMDKNIAYTTGQAPGVNESELQRSSSENNRDEYEISPDVRDLGSGVQRCSSGDNIRVNANLAYISRQAPVMSLVHRVPQVKMIKSQVYRNPLVRTDEKKET